jgi:hypothetical protein
MTEPDDPTDTTDDDATEPDVDQILADAEGGIEGSLLDDPDEPDVAPI